MTLSKAWDEDCTGVSSLDSEPKGWRTENEVPGPVHSESPVRGQYLCLLPYGPMAHSPMKMLRLSLEAFPLEDGCVFTNTV